MAKKGNPAAIVGSLVNLKNVATHKSIALTIHCPAENAQAVLAAFGWPTMVDPVPVAVARLEESVSLTQPPPKDVLGVVKETSAAPIRKLAAAILDRTEKLNRPPEAPTRLRHWAEMTPSQQTGVIRNEPDFWAFTGVGAHGAEAARDYIRAWCHVESCADILPGTEAAARWAQLQVRYGNWLRERRGAA
jgi:hypothetical protein